MHVLSNAHRLPQRVGPSTANTHDSLGLKPMAAHFHAEHESHSDHPKPQRLHADKAYDLPDLRRRHHRQRNAVHIAHKRIDSSKQLSHRRQVIEHTIPWPTSRPRPSPRYEQHLHNTLTLLSLTAALRCYKRLGKLTTSHTV